MTLRTDQIELNRTFSTLKDETENIDYLAFSFGRDSSDFTWKDLHEKPLTVVVGEAGIGKTIEFEREVQRLLKGGKKAFFIELNQLVAPDSWELALEQAAPAYEQWKSSLEEGYFFLDAIDEARLTDHAAFKKALTITRASLRQYLGRVRIVISSRWTDWSINEVRATVEEVLVTPIEDARREAKTETEGEVDNDAPTFQAEQPPTGEQAGTFVVKLDPLSRPEAYKLVEAWNVIDAPAFWAAVDDGQYDHMASRPLDLQWMVGLWNQNRSLGKYLDLIEGNIINRLTETNPSYVASRAVLSLDQLRKGAEELAAAVIFTGHAFVATVSTSPPRPDEVAPQTVLTDWNLTEITRLLASAVFDEATYGRVKFHHRSMREYLAACWVNRQLEIGVPLHRVLPLFAASPFGESVLIPTRRWTLCWLASINVKVREWVIRHSPEMFFFDGDPEAWDALSADQALWGYVQRLKDGLRTDWYNDASEFRRVGRRLNSDRLATLLTDPQLPAHVKTDLLPIVKHAHLTDCADAIFCSYKSQTVSSRERRYALEVLATIATPEQRNVIKADLLSGALTSNELIASALMAADWESLTAGELAKVFTFTSSEDSYGGGPMAQSLKYDLLPTATAESATLLLEAVVAVLPRPEEKKRFARHQESGQSERAWLLDVLPDCLERLLTLLPPTLIKYPTICLTAAERIEAFRDLGFTDHEDFSRLHGLIAKQPSLRWQLGLVIAQSEDITHSTSRVTWDMMGQCTVSFGATDIPELITRANGTDSSSDEQEVWFAVAKEVVFGHLRGLARKTALIALETGPKGESRTKEIAERRARFLNGLQHQRLWKAEERQRKRERLVKHETSRDNLCADIQHIRDATARGFLNWLIRYSYDHSHSDQRSFTHVDYEVIAKDFGKDIADALAVGLKVVWANADIPNPADYQNGSVPWVAITALAGLQTLLAEGQDIAKLNGKEAARAALLAVWETNGPPSWFDRLVTTYEQEVCEALHSWIRCDAQSAIDGHRRHGAALEMTLRCPATVRSILLRPLVAMVTSGSVIRSEDTTRAVVKALREDGLIDQSTMAALCRAKLVKSIDTGGLIREIRWLRTWLEEDVQNAWAWFEAHVTGLGATGKIQVEDFAKAMSDCNWVKIPATNDETVEVLLRLHALLLRHLPPPGSPAVEDHNRFGPPIMQLREAIPMVLVQIRGSIAHRALSELAAKEMTPHIKTWLRNCIREHAALEASQSSHVEPNDLRTIGFPFLTEPRNETQLFEQVVARLEEIKKCLEEGPFSDRSLFSVGMSENKLQLWMAARFHETQNRKFGVHREEVVDVDNRTDIQLSSRQWNVCVEIKPVDTKRGSSANSLTKTIRTQIIEQYLKGYNSSHGILVLFRLDEKTWDIPNGAKCQPFSALVAYLQEQARLIKAEYPGVEDLIVFAIDCIAPNNT